MPIINYCRSQYYYYVVLPPAGTYIAYTLRRATILLQFPGTYKLYWIKYSTIVFKVNTILLYLIFTKYFKSTTCTTLVKFVLY